MLGGLDVFLPYVRDYATTYTGKSITTDEWRAHLYGYFEKHGGSENIKALDSINWNVRNGYLLGTTCSHSGWKTGLAAWRGA